MADWEGVSKVLKSRPSAAITPHPGDTTALIPHTFIVVLRRFTDARLALSHHQPDENDCKDEDSKSSLRLSLITEVGIALQNLVTHFRKLLANEERLKAALRGHEEGNVLWIEPYAQQDFVDFIAALWRRSEHSSCRHQKLSELVEWALTTDFDDILDNTCVEQAGDACRSLESAFQTFENAFDRILKTQEDLGLSNNDTVN